MISTFIQGVLLSVTYIWFDDDLLLCCREDIISIQLILKEFNHFFEVFGFKANMEKDLYLWQV